MSTRRHNSEEALADLVCAPLCHRAGARVLIGGLGLGFTLKAALRALAPDAQVVVAEIVGAVIDWNRNPEYALAGAALDDPRVVLHRGDVADALRANPVGFDAIMLDVDNGAEPLIIPANQQLYRHQGIRLAVSALRPGGTHRVLVGGARRRLRAVARRRGSRRGDHEVARASHLGPVAHALRRAPQGGRKARAT
jgi:Spermidine synthase